LAILYSIMQGLEALAETLTWPLSMSTSYTLSLFSGLRAFRNRSLLLRSVLLGVKELPPRVGVTWKERPVACKHSVLSTRLVAGKLGK
jgi:hypothetical protein